MTLGGRCTNADGNVLFMPTRAFWFLGTSAISTQPPKKAMTVILMQPRVHGIYAAMQKTPGVDTQSVEQ
jgi:hypothetical protein